MELKKILVVLDYERDNSAIMQRALRLAAKPPSAAGATSDATPELCLFLADYSDSLERAYLFDQTALENARESFIAARRKWLEKQAEQLRQAGFQVSASARWGKPVYVATLEEAERIGADLILKTTHPHGALGRALLAAGDWHMIRETQVPLWLVKTSSWGERLRLAACIDPLHGDESGQGRDIRLLGMAHELGVTLPAELHVIHAYEAMPTGLIAEFDALLGETGAIRDQVELRHRRAFDQLLKDRVEPTTRCHFEEGPPRRVIPEVVTREGIDLLVLGAVARTRLERLLVGSTAEQVLDAVDADLLVLK